MSCRKWVSDLYQVPVWTGCSCFVSVSQFKARSWTRFIEDCSAWNGYLNSVMWRRLIWPSFVIHCGKDILFALCVHISDHVHGIWASFASLVYGKRHSGPRGRKRQCFTKQDVLSGFNWTPDTRALKAVTHVQAHQWLLFIELDVKSSSSDRRWASRVLKQTVSRVKDFQTQRVQVHSGEGPVRAWPGHIMLVLPHHCPKATTIHLWDLWWGKSFRSAPWSLMEINLPNGSMFSRILRTIVKIFIPLGHFVTS